MKVSYPSQNNSGRSRAPRLIIGAVLALVSVCSYLAKTSTNEVTGEVQHVSLSPDQEIAMGLNAAPSMTREYGGATSDAVLARYVAAVGTRVASQSSAAKGRYPYKFTVLADPDTINAFALPGGPVFVTVGLLKRMTSEAQLAGVLGHEIGHVIGRHGAEKMAQAELSQGLVGAAAVGASDPNDPNSQRRNAQLAAGIAKLVNMKYGRADELEADSFGLKFMSEAGYDPKGMADVMRILESAGGGKQPEFLSTHPNPGNRLELITKILADKTTGGDLNEDAFRANVLSRLGQGGAIAAANPPAASAGGSDIGSAPGGALQGQGEQISVSDLPAEALNTLRLIKSGGPYPFERDGIEFRNRERRLPSQGSGYYREFTVPTPGESDRGARRIIVGSGGEIFYTEDHYESFKRVVR